LAGEPWLRLRPGLPGEWLLARIGLLSREWLLARQLLLAGELLLAGLGLLVRQTANLL
jgi:hypothetical protein